MKFLLTEFQTKYCNTPFLESVFHSAKVILSRFHFVCKGAAVLRVDWDSPATARLAQLDPDQVEFMKVTQSLIKAKGKSASAPSFFPTLYR